MAGDAEVRVVGAERFAATTRAAAAMLGDLTNVHGTVARYAATQALVYVPRATGRLAASIRPSAEPQTATVSTDLVYAPVQENGWPGHHITPHRFMARAMADTEPLAIQAQVQNTNEILHHIKGA